MSYACDVCGRQFNYTSILKLHYRSHTGEKPFHCAFCAKSFSYEAHLIVHHHNHHQRGPYNRELCNDPFLEKSNLEQHSNLYKDEINLKASKKMLPNKYDSNSNCITPTQETSKICSNSNKGFSKSFGSNRPSKSHVQKKQYSCHLCGKICSQKCNLKAHYIVHTKEKPFVCDICGKAYTRNHSLKLHNRIHTEKPFPCELDNVPCELIMFHAN